MKKIIFGVIIVDILKKRTKNWTKTIGSIAIQYKKPGNADNPSILLNDFWQKTLTVNGDSLTRNEEC